LEIGSGSLDALNGRDGHEMVHRHGVFDHGLGPAMFTMEEHVRAHELMDTDMTYA